MVEESKLKADCERYSSLREMPKFQKWMRRYQDTNSIILKKLYKILFVYYRRKNLIDISGDINIGGGLYVGHPYCIVINPKVIIGKNCNIHKNVTIGQENRGKRKGCPVIGNNVWIGVNATIIGKIVIGEDVLIAPNSYVNFDVPSHSIVMGNPGMIIPRENATHCYINNVAR
jgi:hexapeptide transferase family protein